MMDEEIRDYIFPHINMEGEEVETLEPTPVVDGENDDAPKKKYPDVCRICLCSDRQLYKLKGHKFCKFYATITKADAEWKGDPLPQTVCWECNARMASLASFRAKAIHTNALLFSLLRPYVNNSLDVSAIDRSAHKLTSSLTSRYFQADYADYHFVYTETDRTPEIQQINLANLEIDDDTHLFNYLDCSDDILKETKKKVKKKKKVGRVGNLGRVGNVGKVEKVKVDKRCKPANEVLNSDIFNITDLSQEEQMYEIEKRKFSSNYKNAGFKCSECFKGFLDENAFKGHMNRHTDQCGIYKCAICKIRFKKLQALRNHTTSHMQKFSCKRCSYITFRRHAAKLHEEYHNGTKYSCPHCLENFDKLSTYMSHIRIKHPSDIVCELCGYSFVSAKGLGLHKKLKHRFDDQQVPTDGPWCTKCEVQFISKTALERHVQLSARHTSEIISPQTRRQHKYQERNRTQSTSEDKKRRHALKPEGSISCEQCEMQLPDPLSYYRHFRRMHPDKNRTIYPSMKSQSMCEVCGKMFQSLALLQDHSYTHTDTKQFKCTECDKQFVRKYRLIAHQRVHGNSRGNHVCSVCAKCFTTASNMRRHMVSHTGLKQFKCEMCGKCFKHVSEKRVHITYVHLKKPWPKRARGKRKDIKQNPVQHESQIPAVTNIQPVDMDMLIQGKPVYYDVKM